MAPNTTQHQKQQEQSLEWRAERLRLTAQWQTRPHGRLTDVEVGRAIRHAERRQAEHAAAADRARQQLAEREPAVADGSGPRVARLDAELHRLRVDAERQGTVEAIERRWRAATLQAREAAGRATAKQLDADRTRLWQPGRRDRLQAEAAADKALSQRALAEAQELARHAAELQRQLGGPTMWQLARQQAEHAEASYERDRQHALQADHDELTRLRDRVTSLDTAAMDAGTRRDELLAEQQLRAAMPDTQATLEHQLRTQAIEQRQQLHQQPALERQVEQSLQRDVEFDHRSIEPDIDRGGPSLGP